MSFRKQAANCVMSVLLYAFYVKSPEKSQAIPVHGQYENDGFINETILVLPELVEMQFLRPLIPKSLLPRWGEGTCKVSLGSKPRAKYL